MILVLTAISPINGERQPVTMQVVSFEDYRACQIALQDLTSRTKNLEAVCEITQSAPQ